MIPYHYRSTPDDSGVTMIHSDMKAAQDSPVHQHDCYELALIVRGSCEIQTPATRAPLIPGDLFLIRPDQPHVFRPDKNTFIMYCQFAPNVSPRATKLLLDALHEHSLSESAAPSRRVRELRAFERESRSAGVPLLLRAELEDADNPVDFNNLLHLNRAETERILLLYQSILNEQNERTLGFAEMKRLLLEQLLILLSRMLNQQFTQMRQSSSWQRDFIDSVLAEIEENLARNIDFEAIASSSGITLSHFRTIFKRYTGLSPIDYLNRARVLRALELLQTTELSVSEIAVQVGIYDANYFSRLFKKVTGYPPRYFKAISKNS